MDIKLSVDWQVINIANMHQQKRQQKTHQQTLQLDLIVRYLYYLHSGSLLEKKIGEIKTDVIKYSE